jgi:hypothetical protein
MRVYERPPDVSTTLAGVVTDPPVVPFPIRPSPLLPQHLAVPSTSSAQLSLPPAPIARPAVIGVGTGVMRTFVVPSPISPLPL